MKAKVCDCIPGAGKTEAAITMMRSNPGKRFIFVTPYLEEVQRIKDSCAELGFQEPEARGKYVTKSKALHSLLQVGVNIVHSHALFGFYTEETRDLIEAGGYTLVLDEVMNVINKEPIRKADLDMLFESKCIEFDDDGVHLRWIKPDYEGCFAALKRKAEMHNLFYLKNRLLFWSIPVRSFEAFQDVYILTYLFRAQVQKCYYEINGLEFEYIGVRQTNGVYHFAEAGALPEYTKTLIDKVHILDNPKLNVLGNGYYALSSGWHREDLKDEESKGKKVRKVGSTTYNVLYNYFHASIQDTIWTTYKEQVSYMDLHAYEKRHVACSTRATNAYRHCHKLAYCVNLFFNPDLEAFLKHQGAQVEEDLYALSEMIQWIWRSAIRSGEEIDVFVPSERMRTLLVLWLESLAAGVGAEQYIDDNRHRLPPKEKKKRDAQAKKAKAKQKEQTKASRKREKERAERLRIEQQVRGRRSQRRATTQKRGKL